MSAAIASTAAVVEPAAVVPAENAVEEVTPALSAEPAATAADLPTFLPATEQPGDQDVVAAMEKVEPEAVARAGADEPVTAQPTAAHPATVTTEEKVAEAKTALKKKPIFQKLFSFLESKPKAKKETTAAEAPVAPVTDKKEETPAVTEAAPVLPAVETVTEGQHKPLVDAVAPEVTAEPTLAAEPVLAAEPTATVDAPLPVGTGVDTVKAAEPVESADAVAQPVAEGSAETAVAPAHEEPKLVAKAEKLGRRLSARIGQFGNFLKAKSPSKEKADPIAESQPMPAVADAPAQVSAAPASAEAEVAEPILAEETAPVTAEKAEETPAAAPTTGSIPVATAA